MAFPLVNKVKQLTYITNTKTISTTKTTIKISAQNQCDKSYNYKSISVICYYFHGGFIIIYQHPYLDKSLNSRLLLLTSGHPLKQPIVQGKVSGR